MNEFGVDEVNGVEGVEGVDNEVFPTPPLPVKNRCRVGFVSKLSGLGSNLPVTRQFGHPQRAAGI